MTGIGIIGYGMTKFGEHWDRSLRSLAVEASLEAIKNAGITKSDIQTMYVGNMSGGSFAGQEHLASIVAGSLGLNCPSVRCEAACASGAVTLRSASVAIKSGYDIALVVGVEKMSDLSGGDVASTLMGAADSEWEGFTGLTFAGLYAMIARAHMNKFGTTQEQLAQIAVINHKNAVGNAYAQYPFPIKIEDVLNSAMVADPLTLYDCSPISDGAAAIVLASERIAKKMDPTWLLACEQANDHVALHERSLTEMKSVKLASKVAFSKAGLTQKDIDLAEVHDCFSINEIIGLEDLGFCEKGRGGKFVESGEIEIGGALPVNATGGLKAIGHPVGATGIRQIIDLSRLLKGKAHNKVDGRYGISLNVGGTGATAVTSIVGIENGKV